MRSLREAVVGIRRAPLLSGLSVTAIGLAIFSLGLFALTAHNIHLALSGVEERVEVVAYVRDGTTSDRLELAKAEIESFPEVETVRFVSKVEALYQAQRELTEFSDVFSDLEVNPLPASFEVRLAPGYRTPTSAEAVADRLTGYGFVEEIRYGREWVDRVYALRRIAGGSAVMLGGSFAVGAILLIGIAVRMAVLARAREISIMQTVGATDGYIRRPFLLEGLLTGVAGGLLALGLTRGVHLAIDRTLFSVAWLPVEWSIGGVLLGGILGMLAAGGAVRRELRRLDVG